MCIRFLHNTYLYAFAIPFFSVPEKPTAFVGGNAILFYLSRRSPTTPRLPDTAAVSPSIGLHPFLIHTLIRKVRKYSAGSSFSHCLKRILHKLPAFRKPFFRRLSPAFLSRTFKSVSFEPIPFLPNPFVQLPGSSLSLRFALSSLLFPFGSSFPLGKTYCRKGFQSQMKERTNPASEKNIQETSSAFLFSVGSCFLFSSLSVILIYRFFSHLSSTFQ